MNPDLLRTEEIAALQLTEAERIRFRGALMAAFSYGAIQGYWQAKDETLKTLEKWD